MLLYCPNPSPAITTIGRFSGPSGVPSNLGDIDLLRLSFNLPVEVIEAIADKPRYSYESVLAPSLVQRNQKTLHHFGQACFATLETDFSHNDLKNLQRISRNERFNVRTLIFRAGNSGFGRGYYWHRLEEGCVETRLSAGVRMLEDILKGMTKCNSFCIQTLGMERAPTTEYLQPSDVIGIMLSLSLRRACRSNRSS